MILVINCPYSDYKHLNINKNSLKKELSKIDKVEFYDTKFSFVKNKKVNFVYKDLLFENIAEDIKNIYGENIYVIGIEYSSAYALYFSQKYLNCKGVVCFPLRGYSKEGLDRRIHKYKKNNGWKLVTKKYDIENYFLNINDKIINELIQKQKNREERLILLLASELELRKQYKKLKEKYLVPTMLYIRLDFDKEALIKRNYKTKGIAEMKQITSEDDAILYICVTQMSRISEIDKLIKKNRNNKNLIINYIPHQDNKFYNYGNYVVNGLKSIFNFKKQIGGDHHISGGAGGELSDKIKLNNDNIEVICINTNSELEKYKEELIELTKICEPGDEFIPKINEPYDIFWIIKYKDEIVGYLKSTDLEGYKEFDNFELLGGKRDKKGLQISGACNGIPKKYKNMATPLLNKIEEYAKEEDYNYILLHARTDRPYLVNDNEGERKGLYIKNGYKKARILEEKNSSFDSDMWIMYKEI
jgi:hypothetical protein